MYAYQKAIDIRPAYIRGVLLRILQTLYFVACGTNCRLLRAGHVNMGMAYQNQDRQVRFG